MRNKKIKKGISALLAAVFFSFAASGGGSFADIQRYERWGKVYAEGEQYPEIKRTEETISTVNDKAAEASDIEAENAKRESDTVTEQEMEERDIETETKTDMETETEKQDSRTEKETETMDSETEKGTEESDGAAEETHESDTGTGKETQESDTGTEKETEKETEKSDTETEKETEQSDAGIGKETEKSDAGIGKETEQSDTESGKETEESNGGNAAGEQNGTGQISTEQNNSETKTESESETEYVTESADALMTDEIPEFELEDMTETAEDEELELLELYELEEDDTVSLFSSYTPPGTIASASGTGYTAVTLGDRRYSGSYSEIQRNSSSVVTPWDNSGGHVTRGSKVNSAGTAYTYFIPKDSTAAGKFGFKVSNVAYNRTEKCFVDMIITVVAYNDFVYTNEGKKITGIYPCIGYTPKGGFAYQSVLPGIRLKCELVKSGTNTAVSGKYRFTLTDIDAGQIYGITLFDGKIDAKYCMKTTVVHTGTRTLSDGNLYYMLYAPDPATSDSSKMNAVSFEVSNMSSFGLFIDSARRVGTVGAYSENYIREKYQSVKNGEWETNATLLGWDSWAFGPPEVSPVNKYVSNEGTDWVKENTLDSVDSEFWYMLELYAPEMSGYSYQQFYLRDLLPDGVDYLGNFSAVKMETGKSADAYFSVSGGDDLTLKYNGTSGFNGYTYQLRFKVKMDASEVTPAVNGSKAVYTLKNQAVLYYQTNADNSVLTTKSNSVITTVQKERVVPETPQKKINWNNTLLDSREYSSRDDEIMFTVKQKIPAYESFWHMDTFVFEDILDPCFELVRVSLGTEQDMGKTVFEASKSGTTVNHWSFTKENQKITAKLDSGGILNSHFDGNTVYRMDVTVKIKDGYDLFSYYQQVAEGKQAAVIPNKAVTQFGWGNELLRYDTNEVRVWISEVFGTVKLVKKNADTQENIPDAGFSLYQWKKTQWEKAEDFYYDSETQEYCVKKYLLKTKENEGKFKIVESVTPYGFVGSWEQEFVLDGTNGICRELAFAAENKMAKGIITVKKTSESGTALSEAKYEIYAKENIISPYGKVMINAGTKVSDLTTKEDGMAVSDGLYPGVYEIREIMPPKGYVLNAVPVTVQIRYTDRERGASSEMVTFQNKQTQVQLKKVSVPVPEESKKIELEGVSFAVWKKETENEQSAVVYTTDQEGIITLKGLLPGNYCYKETVTLPGYVLDPSVKEFVIDENGFCKNQKAAVLEEENQFIFAGFEKLDKATGERISGAKLQLTDENGTVVDTWMSEDAPHMIYRIAAGNYILSELEAPDGYRKADPVSVEIKESSELQSFAIYDVKYVTITLEKAILADEIVWAHGNPTFTFCVEGQDIDGGMHTYYETVEFTPEQLDTGRYGKEQEVTCQAVFTVPAGKYTAYETNVIRYKLDKIDGAVNGHISGPAVLFDLRGNEMGSAVFHNRKTVDDGITDTCFIRNVMIE